MDAIWNIGTLAVEITALILLIILCGEIIYRALKNVYHTLKKID